MKVSRRIQLGTGHGQGAWPVLLLLVIAVAVPTACVLWFMTEAMGNQRLAVRQKLTEAYRVQLAAVRDRLDAYWRDKMNTLAAADGHAEPGAVFAQLVKSGVCHSLIVCDSSGRVLCPTTVHVTADDLGPEDADWERARDLEYGRQDPAAAAEIYADIAAETEDSQTSARALQSQARCLAKNGQTEAAIDLLAGTLTDEHYHEARNREGRLIVPNALLRALELMGGPDHAGYEAALDALVQRVVDYADPTMSANQRRFLMHELQDAVPDCPPLPTLAAEDLAADYLETQLLTEPGAGYLIDPGTPSPEPHLHATHLAGVLRLTSHDGTLVALFEQDRLVRDMQSLTEATISAANVTVKFLLSSTDPSQPAPFLSVPAGSALPDSHLDMRFQGPDPFSDAADKRIAAYAWVGTLVIVVISALALLVGRYVTRQMKLTRLRNDLIATVSHELKTPLSSMRLLIDTLLEGNYRDERQVREYLELTAKENARLSRLIDNFLTFSRMERNKRAFEFTDVRIGGIVREATEAVQERFSSAGCRFDVELADNLPAVTGDRDALITVLVNLLDNAFKYTGDDKHIILRAGVDDGQVRLVVEDNGIGLSRRAAKKVFDRFYQVDQSLTRRAGGCGLGLSIVRFIVESHGGTIDVSSELGEGSTFAVRLPVESAE